MNTYIVIPTWNSATDFVHCTTRLIAHTRQPVGLIVVENGSRPEQRRVIEGVCAETLSHFRPLDHIGFIQNTKNLGIPVAQNQALDWIAHQDDGPYGVVLLSADAFVRETGWLGKMLAYAENTPDAGVIGGSGSRAWHPLPVYHHDDGRWYVHRNQWEHSFQEGESVDFACVYLRPELLARGLRFDEAYEIYDGYDQDLSFRVRSWGYRVMQMDTGVDHYASSAMKREGYRWDGGGRKEWDELRAKNVRRFAKTWRPFLSGRRQTVEQEIEHMAAMNRKLVDEAGDRKVNITRSGESFVLGG